MNEEIESAKPIQAEPFFDRFNMDALRSLGLEHTGKQCSKGYQLVELKVDYNRKYRMVHGPIKTCGGSIFKRVDGGDILPCAECENRLGMAIDETMKYLQFRTTHPEADHNIHKEFAREFTQQLGFDWDDVLQRAGARYQQETEDARRRQAMTVQKDKAVARDI